MNLSAGFNTDRHIAETLLGHDVWYEEGQWMQREYWPMQEGYGSSWHTLRHYTTNRDDAQDLREIFNRRTGKTIQASFTNPLGVCEEFASYGLIAFYRPDPQLVTAVARSQETPFSVWLTNNQHIPNVQRLVSRLCRLFGWVALLPNIHRDELIERVHWAGLPSDDGERLEQQVRSIWTEYAKTFLEMPGMVAPPVGVKLRFQILERDSFRCQYCGRTPQDGVKLHVDHVVPRSKGGSNDPENLVTACQDCNLGKSDRML